MLSTKDIYRKVYDYIYTWGGALASVVWEIIVSYHLTISFTPGKALFGRNVLFNLTPLVYWRVVTTRNQRQVNIDNSFENSRRVRHDYTVGDTVYLEKYASNTR